MRVGVLASGRGSNLQALIDAQAGGHLGPARLVCVLSNILDAPALERARRADLAAEFLDPRGLTREGYDAVIRDRLAHHRVELLCLAGYMRRLSGWFIDAFPGTILNVHPSLLPAFPGLHAQQQALDYGVAVTGATVHLVDIGLDSGPVVAQEAVSVLPDDSLATLSQRILAAEHRLYPSVVRAIAEGGHVVQGRRVSLRYS